MARFIVTAQLRLAAPTSANVGAVVRQIQNSLRGVTVDVKINVNKSQMATVQGGLKSISSASNEATSSIEKFGKQSALAIRRYTAFAAATGTFLALGSAIKSSFNDAIAFDKQLNKLRQVTGQSARDVESFTKIITELATGLGISSAKLADISLVLAQAGLTAKDTTVALRTLAKTELSATFDDITDTTEGAIAILNQFGGGVNSLERDLSALNSVSAKFAVESSDLVVAVRRTGGAFKAAGGNLNELLALFTSVRQTTRESAETIATGFRTIFTRIQRTRTVNFLETLGIDLRDVEGQFVGPYEAIRKLSVALRNISSTDPRFAQIIEELGGFRQVSKVIPLIQQFAVSEKALSVALRSGNSLTKDAAIAQDSLANKITKVQEQFAALIRDLSKNQAIRNVIEVSLQLASAMIAVADSLKTAIPLIGSLATIAFAKGATKFGRGFLSEIGTTKKFARGGVVPGSGNGDTVPAQLTPGEFVIKKSAAKAIGYDKLAQMNSVQKFGTGSKGTGVKPLNNDVAAFINSVEPGFKPKDEKEVSEILKTKGIKNTPGVREKILAYYNQNAKQTTLDLKDLDDKHAKFTAADSIAGYYLKSDLGENSQEIKTIDYTKLKDSYATLAEQIQSKNIPLPSEVLLKNFTINKDSKNRFYQKIDEPIKRTILAASNALVPKDPAPLDIQAPELNQILKNINIESVYGNIFEGALQAYTKNIRTGGPTAILDFERLQEYKDQFTALFGEGAVDGVSIGDAKLTRNAKSEASLVDKFAREKLNTIAEANRDKGLTPIVGAQKFAKGGGVPGKGNSDTVPALLTPGEFVINKSAAQSIGYSNLNKMNNVQKFAKGGAVGTGTNVTGIALGASLGINILPILLQNFGAMNDQVGDLVSGFSTVIANFALFNTLLGNVTGVSEFTNKVNQGADEVKNLTESFRDLKRQGVQNTNSRARNESARQAIINNPAPTQADAQRLADLDIERDSLIEDKVRIKRQRKKTIKDKRAALDANKVNRATLRGRKIVTAGGAAASAAAIFGAGALRDDANNRFASGDFATGKLGATAAGGLEGAATFAGIGATIGSFAGPVGTAIGALAGGIIGGAQGLFFASQEAQKTIDKIKFDKFFDGFTDDITNIASGKTSFAARGKNVVGGITELRNRLSVAKGADKETLVGQIDNQIVNIEGFLNKVAEGSKTFEEFQNKTQGVSGLFAQFSNQTMSEVNEKFRNLIEATQKQAVISEELAAIEARNAERLREVANLQSAFADLALSASSLNDAQKSYSEFLLSGTISNFKLPDFESQFDRLNNIADKGRFANTTRNIAKTAGAEQLGAELIKAQSVLQILPEILVNATRNTLEEGAFADNVGAALKDAPQFLRESILKNIEQLVGPESKDEKIIRDVLANPLKIAADLAKGEIEAIAEVFKSAAPVIRSQLESLETSFENIRKLSVKLAEGEGKIDETRLLAEKTISDTLGDNKFSSRQNIAVRNRAINRDIAAAGGSDKLTAAAIEERRSTISSLEKRIAKSNFDLNESARLTGEKAKEIAAVEASIRALEKLADASGDVADLQDQLAKATEKRTFKKGLAETLTFGSAEDRRSVNGQALGAIALSRGINVPALRTQENLSFLRGIGDVKLEALGNKSGNQVADETIRSTLSGVLSEKDIEAVLTANEEEKRVAQEIRDRAERAVLAQETLNSLVREGVQKELTGIRENTAVFIDELRKLVASRAEELAAPARLAKEAEAAREENNRANLRRASGLSGVDLSTKDKQDVLKNNIADFQQLDKLNKRKTGLASDSLFNFLKENDGLQDKGKTDLLISRFFANSQYNVKEQNALRGFIDEKFNSKTPDLLDGKLISDFPKLLQEFEDNLRFSSLKETTSQIEVLNESLRKTFSNEQIKTITANLAELAKVIAQLSESKNVDLSSPKPTPKARGGLIPGTGNRDSVPAMLMPGEIVMRKSAVQKYGAGTLLAMNSGAAPMMSSGGLLGAFNLILQNPDTQNILENDIDLDELDALEGRRRRAKLLEELKISLNKPKAKAKQIGVGTSSDSVRALRGSAALNSALVNSIKARGIDAAAAQTEEDKRNAILDVPGFGPAIAQKRVASARNIEQLQKGGLSDEASAKEIARLKALDPGSKTPRRSSYFGSAYTPPKQAGAPGQVTYLDPAVAKKLAREEAGPSAADVKIGKEREAAAKATAIKSAENARKRAMLNANPAVKQARNNASTSTVSGFTGSTFGPNQTYPGITKISQRQEELNRRKELYNQNREDRAAARRNPALPNLGDYRNVTSSTSSGSSNKTGEAVNRFGQNSQELITSLNNFPREISLNANHRVEVIFNGAEVLASLSEGVAKLAVDKTVVVVNKMIAKKMPDIGPMTPSDVQVA